MAMETIYLILLGGIFLLLLILLCLLPTRGKEQAGAQEMQEILLRLENLEHGTGEALRELRGEQHALAHAARSESMAANDRISEQIDKRVARLADMTDKSLERIRTTVDERLNESLEQKFAQVSQRLAEVHHGLGQMQSLGNGVEELRRILANVKVRGIWGEMQLGNILRDMLDRGRYAENAEVRPGSGLRVEYALRLPGQNNDAEVLLPIDAKFPLENYQRLQHAREAGDAEAAQVEIKQLERRLRSEAKDICEKYICPPYSTDFAVMYLPSEGLFAEALNMPGLAEELQHKYRVCLAGPSTLAALINSLQLGFRTLAVQQRTTEVWQLLHKVKQELSSLNTALEKSAKKLDEAQTALAGTARYVNRLTKELDEVQVLEGEDGYGRK